MYFIICPVKHLVNNQEPRGDTVENALFFSASVAIAALIGYVTNHLAIKMLFLPRTTWRIRGWRVPLTPGLIPKRRGEIAVALGKVVSEYLVTAEGVKSMLMRPELRTAMEQKLRAYIEHWAGSEETLEEIAVRLFGADGAARVRQTLEQFVRKFVAHEAREMWERNETMRRPLRELIHRLNIPIDEWLKRTAAERVISALRDELNSPGGTRLIRGIVNEMVRNLGGMMGLLAGMFFDEDKIAGKVRDALLSYLHTESAREMIAGIIAKQADAMLEKSPIELLGKLKEMSEQNGLSAALDFRGTVASNENGMQANTGMKEPGAPAGGVPETGNAFGANETTDSIEASRASDDADEADGEPERAVDRPHQEILPGEAERDKADSAAQERAKTPDDAGWFAALAERTLPLDRWLDRLWRMTPRELLLSAEGRPVAETPEVVRYAIGFIAGRIDQVVRAIDLSKLVQEQVEKFPLEQVEKVILDITGREFRAITWLGALLGGMIGSVQALLYIWFGA